MSEKTDSAFLDWVLEMKTKGEKPFGDAYTIFALKAWNAALAYAEKNNPDAGKGER